jgi:hypothetical protein
MTHAARSITEAKQRPCAASASKRFGRYKDEKGKTCRDAQVDESALISRLFEAYRSLQVKHPTEDMYPRARGSLKGLTLSPHIVERFCLAMGELQNEKDFQQKAGVFLSALINRGRVSDKETYRLSLLHLDMPVHYLGLRNKKGLMVTGNVGNNLGHRMERGSILVEGNVGMSLGESMERGLITVRGNSDIAPGHCMRGGKIIIEGDARGEVGLRMVAGEIVVHGRIGSIGRMEARRIYQGRRLVVDK